MKTLYFDESGFTGYNLLDPQQPVFSIGSHDLSDEQAFDLLQKSFPEYRGEEFKFSRIWSRNKNRTSLLNFSKNIKVIIQQCYVYTCDKRFVVLTKMIDSLVEPVVHAAGQDFYANGFNVKYSNMAHFAFSQLVPRDTYSDLLEFYQLFLRNPSEATLRTLQNQYRQMATSCDKRAKSFMDMFVLGAEQFTRYSDINRHRQSNDIHLTSMVSSISFWRSKFKEDFKVIHDESAHFFRQLELWKRITSLNAADAVVYADDERRIEFPLRVAETMQLDSRGSPALQVSDLISGLAAKIKSPSLTDEESTFVDRLLEVGLKDMNTGGLHPGTAFIDSIPNELNGPDAIDQFTKIMYPDS